MRLSLLASALTLGFLASPVLSQQSTQPAPKSAPAATAQTAPKAAAKTAVTKTSVCKGLEKNACEANAACSYVGETVRKDGKKVSAYCRTKPKSAAKAAPATPATKATPATPASPAAPAKKS